MGMGLAVLVGIGIVVHLLMQRRLRAFWKRGCMGTRWKRQYPTAKAKEIREFLNLFVDAFALPRKHRLALSPDDRISDIYAAIYPQNGPNALEYEFLAEDIQRRYGLSATDGAWERVTTLGELFELARRTAKS